MLRQRAVGLEFKEVRDLVLGWAVGTAWCHVRRRCEEGKFNKKESRIRI